MPNLFTPTHTLQTNTPSMPEQIQGRQFFHWLQSVFLSDLKLMPEVLYTGSPTPGGQISAVVTVYEDLLRWTCFPLTGLIK